MIAQNGIKIEANEIDATFKTAACNSITRAGVSISLHSVNWRDFISSREFASESYGFIYSLGNSFPTFLENEKEFYVALLGLKRLLKPGGMVLFDSRNYDHVITCWPQIVYDPILNFNYRYASTYIGQSVRAFPYSLN
jgi:hypothetical protein